MKNLKYKQELQPPAQASYDSDSAFASSNDRKKIPLEVLDFVQTSIERCLKSYMNKDEVAKTLLTKARINPRFTALVWEKLERENPDFFRDYYIRLKLIKQIHMFNDLLQKQYHLMKCAPPLTPIQNGIHPMPEVVHKFPMGYSMLQHPFTPAACRQQPHHDSMNGGGGMSSCHVVNEVPAVINNSHPLQTNSENGAMSISLSETSVSPTPVESNGHIPLTASAEISGVDACDLDIDWDFIFSDNLTDLLEDLQQDMRNYSPFMQSDSLEYSDLKDTVDDFFMDNNNDIKPQGSQPDEGKL